MKWIKNFLIATLLSMSLLLGACGEDTLGEQAELGVKIEQGEPKASKYIAQVNEFSVISRESYLTLSDVFEVLEEENEQEMQELKDKIIEQNKLLTNIKLKPKTEGDKEINEVIKDIYSEQLSANKKALLYLESKDFKKLTGVPEQMKLINDDTLKLNLLKESF